MTRPANYSSEQNEAIAAAYRAYFDGELSEDDALSQLKSAGLPNPWIQVGQWLYLKSNDIGKRRSGGA